MTQAAPWLTGNRSHTPARIAPCFGTPETSSMSPHGTRNPHVSRVDRLAGILRNGLLAPGVCQDGSVVSDLHLLVTGTAVPYDRFVFLHRFGPLSFIYTPHEPGRFAVFVDPAISVLTPEGMGTDWVVLCQDEVYVQDRIAPERLIRVAVHSADAESVKSELMADFQRLGIPLHEFDGNVLWQPAQRRTDSFRAEGRSRSSRSTGHAANRPPKRAKIRIGMPAIIDSGRSPGSVSWIGVPSQSKTVAIALPTLGRVCSIWVTASLSC